MSDKKRVTDKQLEDMRKQSHGEWIDAVLEEVHERRRSRSACHEPTPEDFPASNNRREPEGERIRAELVEFLARNKISSIVLDTATLTVDIQSARLPPRMKCVLARWGSIYVIDDAPDPVRDWKPGLPVPEGYEVVSEAPWLGSNGLVHRLEWVPPVRPEGWDDDVIPPMTHPLSSAWDQPPLDRIRIDADTATMDQEAFDWLSEYSTSFPSGVYEGKMWKRRVPPLEGAAEEVWQLRWYGYSKIGPGHVSNHQRRIVIEEAE